MTMWEWEGLGILKAIPAHLYLEPKNKSLHLVEILAVEHYDFEPMTTLNEFKITYKERCML